ncbi:MAG: hypothetical protein U0228_21655 [Myxococcaceae bacterium]
MSLPGGYEIAWQFAQALEALGVEYFLGGSMASSLQGPSRFTNDIDIVAHLRADQVDALVARLGPDFDVDDVALKESIKARRSWNVFHVPTATRIDLFPVGSTEFDVEELARRQRREVGEGRALYVKSPEDTVLRKLLWFQRGGESNTQQFRDAVEVLRFQGSALNGRYLDVWAEKVGVTALLRRARESL